MVDESQLHRLRIAARGLAILSLVVFVGLIAFSAYQLYGIQERVRLATAQLARTEAKLKEAESRKVALDQEIADLETSVEALKEISARAARQSPEVIKQATEETIAANPRAAQTLPRVFLQIGDESQREAAESVVARLQKAGFLVPGIENVGSKAPELTDLRSFHRTDPTDSDVQAIVDVLEAAGVAVKPVPVPGYEDVTKKRHYELWFGQDFPQSSSEPSPEEGAGSSPAQRR